MKKKNNNIYGVIGLGRFGGALARELAASGAEVIAVDENESAVRDLRDHVENVMLTDNLSAENLRSMGFADCNVVVVAIGSRLDVSMLTVLNVMSLGVTRVVAKASSRAHGALLEKIGAEVIYPERDSGIQLARSLTSSGVLDCIQLSNKIDLAEFDLPKRLFNVPVMKSGLRADFGLNIVAISRGEEVIINIKPDQLLLEGDRLLLIGSNDSIRMFAETK